MKNTARTSRWCGLLLAVFSMGYTLITHQTLKAQQQTFLRIIEHTPIVLFSQKTFSTKEETYLREHLKPLGLTRYALIAPEENWLHQQLSESQAFIPPLPHTLELYWKPNTSFKALQQQLHSQYPQLVWQPVPKNAYLLQEAYRQQKTLEKWLYLNTTLSLWLAYRLLRKKSQRQRVNRVPRS